MTIKINLKSAYNAYKAKNAAKRFLSLCLMKQKKL